MTSRGSLGLVVDSMSRAVGRRRVWQTCLGDVTVWLDTTPLSQELAPKVLGVHSSVRIADWMPRCPTIVTPWKEIGTS